MNPIFLIFLLGALYVFWGLAENVLQNSVRKRNGPLFRAVPYTPRRPVPWNGWELLLFFYGCLTFSSFASRMVAKLEIADWFSMRVFDPAMEEQLMKEHGLAQLIIRGQDAPGVILLTFVVAVIIVPIGEEVLFRLLFQGYLEKKDGFFRRVFSFLFSPENGSKRRSFLRGLLPILISSSVFAMLHLRGTVTPQDYRDFLNGMIAYLIAYPTFLFLLTVYLLVLRRANWADLGIDFQKIPKDFLVAFLTIFCLFPPVYALNIGLNGMFLNLPLRFALDPIPLFFLAVGLGFLYYRTHRILPCILVHCAFNLIAFVTACLVVK